MHVQLECCYRNIQLVCLNHLRVEETKHTDFLPAHNHISTTPWEVTLICIGGEKSLSFQPKSNWSSLVPLDSAML